MKYAVAAALFAGAIWASPPVEPGDVSFTAHTVATELRGGYQSVIVDLNKDGKPDIIALASGLPDLLWFENPSWQRHVLASGFTGLINVSAFDVDKDGIPELGVASGFATVAKNSPGIMSILTHGADVTAPWTVKEIDRVPTAHRVRWIDPDGSGNKVLALAPLIGPDAVAPDYKSPVALYFYRPPEYKREPIADTFTGLFHGIEAVAWEGGRGQALLSAGFMGVHMFRFANGKWTTTELLKGDPAPWPKSGSSDVYLGRLGRETFLATIEPWHGNQVVVYRKDKDAWRRQVIDSGITDGHTLIGFDADGDGRDELVAGQRGGERSLIMYTASANGDSWTRRVVDEGGMAGAGCAAGDLNGDKRSDIVCIGTATANLKWYENLGKK
jgi:hypothetical protein